MSTSELNHLLNVKREHIKAVEFLQPIILRRGHVETTKALVVTGEAALLQLKNEEQKKIRANEVET